LSKKGNNSVGVSRQWYGRLGKIDNCQVGVYTALCCRDKVSLIDTRLFLPKSWTDNQDRCISTGVPEDRLNHLKKAELALEMIKSARSKGVNFQWIGGDAFYGDDPELLRQLDEMDETFVLDIHKDQAIYLEKPTPYVPERKSHRGRKPTRLKTDQLPIKICQWADEQADTAWKDIFIRHSTKSDLTVKALHRHVWIWDRKGQKAHHWHLIVSESQNSKDKRKYSLSNAPLNTPIERLVFMQSQRFGVERAIEDGKSYAGLADYQVRTWTGWHHHMAMVMLALLFMLETKIKYNDSYLLLSCYDIQDLLSHFLPRRDITKKDVIKHMFVRHKQRELATEFYFKNKICNLTK